MSLQMTQKPINLMFVLLLLFATATSAQQPERPARQNPRRSIEELVRLPVVYSLPGMERVVVKSNLKYVTTGEPHMLMDVYVPPGLAKNARRPAVLFIHGSVPPGSPAKDMGAFRSWGRLAAASNMVGVTFTHRLGFPKPLLNEAAGDVNAAINYIRTHAGELNIDKDRICLAAYSGGGPMLSMAMRDKPEYVRCLVSFYAFLDIQNSNLHRPHEPAETLKNFSPVTYLTAEAEQIAPLFIARAGLDEVPGLNESIDRFVQQAMTRNASVTVINHPRGPHAFDIQTDDERSCEIIQAALAFMSAQLGAQEK
ncbi:MAG TPA: alpha/beta hydrolase [Pyrinomonadaceae bacterium]|nr:alpha/beta hydrolase [Pyrinomonadaceae bacterium]